MNPMMLKKLQQMQQEMLKQEQEINKSVFYGSVGGIIKVEILGTKEIQKIKIEELVENLDELAEMITMAINQAHKAIDETKAEKMSAFENVVKGFNI